MLKRLFENKHYKKKYDELLTIVSKVLVEKQNIADENAFLRKQIKKLTDERKMAIDGLTK